MIYKGCEIEVFYLPGSTIRYCAKTHKWVERKPKKEDIDYVLVTPPEGMRFREKSVSDAKAAIKRELELYP